MAGPVIGMCHSILLMVKDIDGITCDRMYVICIFTWELSWDIKWKWALALHWKKKMEGPVIGMRHLILLMVKDIGGITCDRMNVIFIFTWELSWELTWNKDGS